jgi:hypothetical protein
MNFIRKYFYMLLAGLTYMFFLLLDPIYLSILSLFVGGDINGIAIGLNVPYIFIRCIYFGIAVVNTSLVFKRLYPSYVIKKPSMPNLIDETGRR